MKIIKKWEPGYYGMSATANQDNPILSFISKLSLSKPLPLVKKIKILFLAKIFDEYTLRPLDVIKVKKHNSKIKWLTYWHAGIYLGRGKFFHLEYQYFPGEKKSRQRSAIVTNWQGFSRNACKAKDKVSSMLFIYQSLVPYKSTEKILTQIARVILNGYRKYNLFFYNCEHLVNILCYGINYSQQVQHWKRKLLGKHLVNKQINLKKEIIKNDQLIANLNIDQTKLTNKIRELQEYSLFKI